MGPAEYHTSIVHTWLLLPPFPILFPLLFPTLFDVSMQVLRRALKLSLEQNYCTLYTS